MVCCRSFFLSLGPVEMPNFCQSLGTCWIYLTYPSEKKKRNIQNIWKKGALIGQTLWRTNQVFFYYCKLSQVATT